MTAIQREQYEQWIANFVRFSEPLRLEKRAAFEAVQGIEDPAEAWELLSSRGLLPSDWFESVERAFYSPARTCIVCGWTEGTGLHEQCTGSVRPTFAITPHPGSVRECARIAADVERLRTAEVLAMEASARLQAWGGTPLKRILWLASGAFIRRADHLYEFAGLVRIALKSAGMRSASARLKPAFRAAIGNGRGSDLFLEDLSAMLDFQRACDEELEIPVNAEQHATPHSRKEHWKKLAGMPFATLPNPFEPLFQLWNSGVALDELDATGSFVVPMNSV